MQTQRFVALLSSGLDSPIATYQMLKRGYDAVLLSFDVSPTPNPNFRNKIMKVANLLHKLTKQSLKIYIVNHHDTLRQFVEKGKRKLTCILCKSYMLIGAYELAKQIQADFIVNGDILGEQASQTINNIAVIQKFMPEIPVIRPLIGYEKKDILYLSHLLGFYELSTLPDVQCNFNPMYPETHANENEVINSINNIDLEEIARLNIENAQILVVE